MPLGFEDFSDLYFSDFQNQVIYFYFWLVFPKGLAIPVHLASDTFVCSSNQYENSC